MEKKFRCNKADICGLGEKCFHGKPHNPIRCGNCYTWCADSMFCQQGMACSGARHGELRDGQLLPFAELLPMKCVEITE